MRISSNTGQAMSASTGCPALTAPGVEISTPPLLIFTLSPTIQVEPKRDPVARYLTASRKGKRWRVRRSRIAGVGFPLISPAAIPETSLRETGEGIYGLAVLTVLGQLVY